jgi:hypothetical protein
MKFDYLMNTVVSKYIKVLHEIWNEKTTEYEGMVEVLHFLNKKIYHLKQ